MKTSINTRHFIIPTFIFGGFCAPLFLLYYFLLFSVVCLRIVRTLIFSLETKSWGFLPPSLPPVAHPRPVAVLPAAPLQAAPRQPPPLRIIHAAQRPPCHTFVHCAGCSPLPRPAKGFVAVCVAPMWGGLGGVYLF